MRQRCLVTPGRSRPVVGRFWSTVGVVALVAGLLASHGSGAPGSALDTAGALAPVANTQTFTDATGDNQGGAPDLTTIRVSNDDQGVLTFELVLPNRPELFEPDFVTVNLDVDRSVATGCDLGAGFGLDWVLAYRGHTAPVDDGFALLRYNGCTVDQNSPQGSFTGSYDGATTTLTLRLPRTDLGTVTSFRFLVIASVDPVGPETWDLGGELDPWLYEIQIAPPRPPRDEEAPRIKALKSTGVVGGVAKLRYSVFDESGKAREEIRVLRGGKLVATIKVPLGARSGTKIYGRAWRVPKRFTGASRFCVRAWDAAGNRSPQSCAALVLR